MPPDEENVADAEEETNDEAEVEVQAGAETDEAEVETDDLREGVLAEIVARLGDAVVASHIAPGRGLWVRVRLDSWVDSVEALVGDLGFTYFGFLSVIDWMIPPEGRYEDTEFGPGDIPTDDDTPSATVLPEGPGYTGGDSRFQLLLQLGSVTRHLGVTIKADLDPDVLEAPTISHLLPGANWHERETHEMFGVNFVGHPFLAHLYLPHDFEGHPLRKDFPLLARVVKPWPGVVDVEPIPEHLEAQLEAEALEAFEGGGS